MAMLDQPPTTDTTDPWRTLQGTAHWGTDYDCEFAATLGLNADALLRHPAMVLRPATPRSLKRGFVTQQDYQRLGEQALVTEAQAEQLRARLAAATDTMHSWQSDEAALLRAFQEEHQLLGQTGRQLGAALESYHVLMALAEQNRALMGSLSGDIGSSFAPATPVVNAPKQSIGGSPRPALPAVAAADRSNDGDNGPAGMSQRLSQMEADLAKTMERLSHLAGPNTVGHHSKPTGIRARPKAAGDIKAR